MLLDSSLIVLSSPESFKLTAVLRKNPESYENLINFQNLGTSAKELLLHNGVSSLDSGIKNLNSNQICDGMLIKFCTIYMYKYQHFKNIH
jgi:hypothetical protein